MHFLWSLIHLQSEWISSPFNGSLEIPGKLSNDRPSLNSQVSLAINLFKMVMKSLESDLTVCFTDLLILWMVAFLRSIKSFYFPEGGKIQSPSIGGVWIKNEMALYKLTI